MAGVGNTKSAERDNPDVLDPGPDASRPSPSIFKKEPREGGYTFVRAPDFPGFSMVQASRGNEL